MGKVLEGFVEVEIKNISKKYKMKMVLDKISLTIAPGTIYGVLGKNGVGKTTLINILTGFVLPEEGSIKFGGKNFSNEIKKSIGLVSESNCLIEELTGIEYLNFIANLYKIESDEVLERIEFLTSYFFDDKNELQKYISSYSTGMKKKLKICTALLNKPRILILDEPFSGLDTISATKFIAFLKNYHNRERVVIISSHNLHYLEKIVTNLGVIDEGKLLFDGSISEFTNGKSISVDDSLYNTLNINKPTVSELEWRF